VAQGARRRGRAITWLHTQENRKARAESVAAPFAVLAIGLDLRDAGADCYNVNSGRKPCRGLSAASPVNSGYERGQVAQMVERSPEKAGVGGSIPSLATINSVTYRPRKLAWANKGLIRLLHHQRIEPAHDLNLPFGNELLVNIQSRTRTAVPHLRLRVLHVGPS
jgi:hypothetical protein